MKSSHLCPNAEKCNAFEMQSVAAAVASTWWKWKSKNKIQSSKHFRKINVKTVRSTLYSRSFALIISLSRLVLNSTANKYKMHPTHRFLRHFSKQSVFILNKQNQAMILHNFLICPCTCECMVFYMQQRDAVWKYIVYACGESESEFRQYVFVK